MAGIRADLLAYGAAAVALDAALSVLAVQRPVAAAVVVAVTAAVVLAVARPGATLLVAAAGLIVSADLLGLLASAPNLSVAGLQVEISDLFLAAMLLAAAARGARALPYATILRMPAFPAWVAFAALGAYDLGRGGYGTMSSVRIFGYCIVVPLVVRSVGTAVEVRRLGRAVVGGGAITSLIALAMVASGRSVTGSGLSTGGVRGLSIGGSFLVAAALLYVLACVAAGDRVTVRTVLLVLLLVAGVGASGARETWLGLVVALALIVVAVPFGGTLRIVLVFALAGLVAAGAYAAVPHPPQLEQQLAAMEHRLLSVRRGSEDTSVSVRYDKWRVVSAQARAHPLLGTGFGYPATYTSNVGGSNFVRAYVDDPENTHLWLLARMGIVGFAAWAALNLGVLAQLLRTARARPGVPRVTAIWGAGIVGVVLAGMTFSPVSAFSSTLLLYWFAVALAPVSAALER